MYVYFGARRSVRRESDSGPVCCAVSGCYVDRFARVCMRVCVLSLIHI